MSETMVVLLAFILVAIVLLAFSTQLSDLFKGSSDIETCRLSVLAQAQTRKTPIGIDAPTTLTPLKCPRRNIKIFENKVELNGKKTDAHKFKQANNDEVNHVAAEELRLCWYMLNEGKKNILENSRILGGDNTCLICSEISFDDKLKEKVFSGLEEYANSKKTKEGITYFEYLTRSQKNMIHSSSGETYEKYYSIWSFGPSKENTEGKLLGNQKYAIYFAAYKPAWLLQKIPGTKSQVFYAGIGEENSIAKQCDILAN